jgi:3-deoxy-D-arabino-heptulosonate 7-phosphate (DAHP) synthase class II
LFCHGDVNIADNRAKLVLFNNFNEWNENLFHLNLHAVKIAHAVCTVQQIHVENCEIVELPIACKMN